MGEYVLCFKLYGNIGSPSGATTDRGVLADYVEVATKARTNPAKGFMSRIDERIEGVSGGKMWA